MTLTPIPEDADADALAVVADFYDRALLQAIGNGALLFPDSANVDAAVPKAKAVARALTEDRFGVRLVLPGEGG